MAHAAPSADPTPTRPSLSPLAVKDWSGAARSTTLTEATELHGRGAAYSLPRPRRAFSDEVVVLHSSAAAGQSLRRKDSFVEDWRVCVSPPVYDLDSCVEQLGLSPPSLDEASEAVVESLFSGNSPVRAPSSSAASDVQRNASFGQVEAAHSLESGWSSSSLPFDANDEPSLSDADEVFTDSFASGGLELDFSGRRGRRASRIEDTESMRQSSVARTAASRRVLSVGKTGPSLGLHTESATSSPSTPTAGELALAHSSSASSASLQAVTTRSRSATVLSDSAATSRRRSIASESLARLVSDSPTSPSSPPRQLSRPLNRRRHSSYTRLSDEATATPYPDSSVSPSPSRNSPTLTSSLSRYLSSGRRGSQPTSVQTSATGSGTATPAAPANAKERDLRKPPPSGTLHALTSSLAFLPAFPFPGQQKSVDSSGGEAKDEREMRMVPWSSIQALYVCFKPSSPSLAPADSDADEDTLTSDIVNAWLVGLQELSVGGSRAWDPRLLCPEPPSPPLSDSSLHDSPPLDAISSASTPSLSSSSPSSSEDSPAVPRKRRRKDWPTVTTLVSVPPAVWVERKDGGWREFDPKGMGVEVIMRNVLLVPPSTAV